MKYTKQPLSVAAQIIAISPPISTSEESIRNTIGEANIFLSYGRYRSNGFSEGLAGGTFMAIGSTILHYFKDQFGF